MMGQRWFLAVCMMIVGVVAAAQTERIVPVEVKGWSLRGKSSGVSLANVTQLVDGKETSTLEITLDPAKGTRGVVCYRFKPELAVDAYTNYSFKIKTNVRLESDMLSFTLLGRNWKGSARQSITKSAKVFWDNLPLVRRVSLLPDVFYDAEGTMGVPQMRLPEPFAMTAEFHLNLGKRVLDKPLKIWVTDIRFVAKQDQYTRKAAEWKAFVSHYKPDYRDSSEYLLPPKAHRLDKPLSIVREGKPVAVINYSSEDGPAVRTAAYELQKFVQLITGAKLTVRDSVDPKGEVQLVLGKRTRAIAYGDKLFAEELKTLSNTDGYAIKVRGNRLYVFGAEAKGTLNGVYALVENNTDLIWARPHKDCGTVFTKTNDLEFVWGKDVLERPASPIRGWNGFADMEWMARNRCNVFNGGGGGDISWTNGKKERFGVYRQRHCFGHNIGHFLYAKKYFASHPDYYSLVDFKGKRQRRPWNQYCFSNPEMRRQFIKEALDAIRRAPDGVHVLTIDMDDTLQACTCEACMKPIQLSDGTVVDNGDWAFRSTQYFIFLNQVMDEINREFPEWKIKTLAYFWTLIPPKCEVHPNIVPEIAIYPRPNDKSPLYSLENRLFLDLLEAWASKSKEMEVYNYHGLGLEFPRPLSEPNAEDFKLFNRYTLGVSSEYRAGGDRDTRGGHAYIWDYSAMEFWVQTRLYWNPDQNVEQLRKYYLRRTFREAAPAMERFYGTIRSAWLKDPSPSTLGATGVGSSKKYVLDTGLEASLRGHLEEAGKLVRHPTSTELVSRVRRSFETYVSKAHETVKKR